MSFSIGKAGAAKNTIDVGSILREHIHHTTLNEMQKSKTADGEISV